MANYSANIQLVVQGQDRLKYVLNSVEKLNTILSRLKPINLLAPGRGSGADVIGQAKKQLDDFSRAIVNFKPEGIQKRAKELSNTLAGSAAQADALTIALENVGLKTGGFSKQAAEVKNYALALEQARRNTERLNTLSQQVQRGARIQTIAQRFNVSPAAVEERLNNLRDIRYAKDRKAEAERYIALKREEDFELRLQRIRERNAAVQATQAAQLERGKALKGRLGGALSNAAIGGAFPLLFGQGAGAATGGAIGGLLGGAFGGVGGFAGSLIGTLLGDIASRGKAVKQLAEDIGFSAQQTKDLAAAFKVANTDVEKFTAVIQNIRGLGLEIEDQAKAIQLVTRLTELYGGSFEKTGNAITSALESGKVTQATLNQLTSQGITVQESLANKYKVSRDELLQMAKDGKISVQDLINTLVQMGNEGKAAVDKPTTSMDRLKVAVNDLGKNLGILASNLTRAFGPALQWLTDRVTDFVGAISRAIARLADLMNGGRMLQADIQASNRAQAATREKFGPLGSIRAFNPAAEAFYQQQKQLALRQLRPGAFAAPAQQAPLQPFNAPSQIAPGDTGAKGPKPPEDRTASLLADLQAITEIGNAENLIRDLLYEGRDLLAAEVELTKTLADIERDRVKQLEQANYQSEKDAINKTASVRAALAEQEVADKIREINSRRFEEELRARQAVQDAVKVFTDMRKDQELQLEYSKTYLRLVREGMLPAEATRIANFEKLVKQQLSAVEEQIKITELAILEAKARGLSTSELEKQLKIYKDQQEAIKGEAEKGPGKGPTPAQRLQEAIATARGELNDLTDPINQVVAGAKAIGTAFSDAFRGLVTGAMTGQEALAAFFKGVGDHFLDMATMMIAKLIEIYILETVLGFISGAAAGSAPRGTPGAKAPNGKPYYGPAFAEGGFVTGPTRALIGEGGEPEYVIPASKMRTAMGRYSAGARGSSVVSGTGGQVGGEAGSFAATMEPIDVRYSIERINSVDYVTADQFQRGMAQAAQQGAIQGERRAMRTLQNSPATRRRVSV